jgi:hypothetical protein
VKGALGLGPAGAGFLARGLGGVLSLAYEAAHTGLSLVALLPGREGISLLSGG